MESTLDAPASYLSDLERVGLHVRQWKVSPHREVMPSSGGRPPRNSRYASWSNGEIGIFITDIDPSVLTLVEAEVVDDFIGVGLPLADDYSVHCDFEIDALRTPAQTGLLVGSLLKGATVRMTGLKAISLFVKPSTLGLWPGVELPSVLRSVLHSRKVASIRSSAQLQRERDHIVAAMPEGISAPLFYQTKSGMLFWLLIEHLNRFHDTADAAKPVGARLQGQLDAVRDMIARAPQERIGIDEIARRAGLNRTKLRALFKQVNGMTPAEYRTSILMTEAESLLNKEQLPVAEIAYMLGYSSTSSFSYAFKQHFGIAPSLKRSAVLPI